MTPEELQKLVGDAKPNSLKEWLTEWKSWATYRAATKKEASITPSGQRELATLILLDKLLGPECLDKNCEDYDGEHPYHMNASVRAHEEGQKKLRGDLVAANARIDKLLEDMRELDRLEKFSHEIRDKENPRLGLGDGERASLEHARIIWDNLVFSGKITATGRLSSAHPNKSNPPKTVTPMKTVHILVNGRSKCNFSPQVPGSWAAGHAWVSERLKDSVPETDRCAGCYFPAAAGRREQMTANFGKMFFLNEAHELPPIKKSELRKQNKMKREAAKAGKKWCKICLSGPCGLWQHATNGSDFCRKHK